MHNVQFVGDYFVLTTTVTDTSGLDDDQIIAKANEHLKQYYGWDVASVSNDIGVDHGDYMFIDGDTERVDAYGDPVDHVYGIVRCGECDKPTDEDSRCDDCGECRNCANSEMVYNEDRDEYLCEKCADRKNSK